MVEIVHGFALQKEVPVRPCFGVWLQKAHVFWIFAPNLKPNNLKLDCTGYARGSRIHVLGNTMCVILSESTTVIKGWVSHDANKLINPL